MRIRIKGKNRLNVFNGQVKGKNELDGIYSQNRKSDETRFLFPIRRRAFMLIRQLLPSDTEIYRNLMQGGLLEHPEEFRISPDDPGEPLIPFISPSPNSFTLGAFLDDGSLVGTVSFRREPQLKLHHKGLMYRMYVPVAYGGRGFGRALIREMILLVRQMEGLEQINLTVVATNKRAKELYLSEGFLAFAFEPKGLKINGRYFDEEQMALLL